MSAGAQFGYLLLWVIASANIMAMFVQSLSAELGLATGCSLPQNCRRPAVLDGSAALLFAVALLASGFASASVGTYAGQVIMEGFLRRRIRLFARRALTLAPALLILAVDVDPTRPWSSRRSSCPSASCSRWCRRCCC
ncbi:divalent metal cation transporter [Geodermatophilus sp. CPCC 206100]|uniref:divalent metal cation transporter n=1 Tax=Geodermatophilus sp. CPCC 206100 TaxID=3020054 RepID=UPI003B000880